MVFLSINLIKMIKNIALAIAVTTFFLSCEKKKDVAHDVVTFAKFGDSISAENALSTTEMMRKYTSLKEGDTLDISFTSTINEVCKKKGCWMTLALPEDNEAFVKFKDYGFFVPMNAQKKEVVVQGKAFISIESVDELKHYAKDAGKSQAAIDSIIAPKTTYSFVANGVLIAK
jgi:hypothetical protein